MRAAGPYRAGMARRRRPDDPRERFIARAEAALAAFEGVERVERRGDELIGHQGGGRQPAVLYLTNLWLQVQHEPVEEQDAAIDRLFAVTTPEPLRWDSHADVLFPVIRPHALAANAPDLCARTIAPFVVEGIVADLPGRLQFLTVDVVRDLGRTEDEVREQARENLARSGLAVAALGGDLEGVHIIGAPEGLESSWLALPEALVAAEELVGSPVVAFAPTSIDLLLVGGDQGEVVARAADHALQTYRSRPRPISPVAYTVVDGVLVPWIPPEGHPAWTSVRRNRAALATTEYADQARTLKDLFERVGENVFVAEAKGIETNDGDVFTWAAWLGDKEVGLLPRVDRIAFARADRTGFLVPWDDVLAIVGDLLEPGTWDPPRWRYRSFPDPKMFQQLEARRVDL